MLEVSHGPMDAPHPCTYRLNGLLKKKRRREVGRGCVGGICEELEGDGGGVVIFHCMYVRNSQQ